MGRPQATQISKRLAKTLVTQVSNSTDELAQRLHTSSATILRFRTSGLITHQNLKKIACFTFFPPHTIESISVGEKMIDAEMPLSVRLFVKADPLTYDVHIKHKEKGDLFINVLWKKTFEAMKDNRVHIRSLMDVGYQYLVIIDEEEMPKLYELKELEEKLPKEDSLSLEGASTERMVKELCQRGFKVTLETKLKNS
jgi:hypothetical protein